MCGTAIRGVQHPNLAKKSLFPQINRPKERHVRIRLGPQPGSSVSAGQLRLARIGGREAAPRLWPEFGCTRKSARPFKEGLFCADVSEFESHMPSQAVRAVWR